MIKTGTFYIKILKCTYILQYFNVGLKPYIILMGGAKLSKSLIQLSGDGWGCVPSLLFDLRPNYGGGMKKMATSFIRSRAHTAPLSALALRKAISDPRLCRRLLVIYRKVWVSFLWGSLLLSPGPWCTRLSLYLPRVYFPVLCKFCNQIPLASKVKFSGSSQSLFQIPRFGNLLWVLELY